ncbi:MAG: pyridoxal 5'-phosphate synthase, partial [Prolixibacteraceae bacterium]|nr:pyridoxal 5'-phosphate synthase [Prolixibacteraceae bacterium]
SEKLSDEYFNSRPVESKISAWASEQSEKISSRTVLEKKFEEYSDKFKNGIIPRPPHWGGFRVEPISIEFWQGRANRLHDRFLYSKNKNNWIVKQLAP